MSLFRSAQILPPLEDIVELLEGLGTMLMQIDAKLERMLSALEEDD